MHVSHPTNEQSKQSSKAEVPRKCDDFYRLKSTLHMDVGYQLKMLMLVQIHISDDIIFCTILTERLAVWTQVCSQSSLPLNLLALPKQPP